MNSKLLTPRLLRHCPMPPRATVSSLVPLLLLLRGIHAIFTRGNTINCDRARSDYIRIQWSRGTLHDTSDVNRARHALYCIPTEEITTLRFVFDIHDVRRHRHFAMLQQSKNLKSVDISFYCHVVQLIKSSQDVKKMFTKNMIKFQYLFGKRFKYDRDIFKHEKWH